MEIFMPIEHLSKQQVVDTLADLYGLLLLIKNRNDLGIELREAIFSNHRAIHARDILKVAGVIKDDGTWPGFNELPEASRASHYS